MNSITVSIGYMLAILMICVSSKDYHVMSDTNKVTKNAPYNFSFLTFYDFLLMEITLKNIPQTVTDVYLVYSMNYYFYPTNTDTKPERVKVDAEIKNGEVKILILRSVNKYRNILVDVELQTKEGLCNKVRVAEGRLAVNTHCYRNSTIGYVYWHTHWKYDVSGAGACLVPKLCDIAVDFQSQCEENFKCYFEETKYICTYYSAKMNKSKPYSLYQTYDTDRPRTKQTSWKDYTYIDALDSFYKIHTTPKNWIAAKQECVKEGASLFYPENSDEAETVISFWTQKQNSINYMYVGISDIENEGAFVTIDGKAVSEVYQKWKLNQPDNWSNEDCVHMTQKGEYNDILCASTYDFICKKSFSHKLSLISAPLESSAGYTKFIIELESFDNKTSVHVETSEHRRDIPWSDPIILPTNVPVKNIVKEQSYSETTEVQFSCQQYKSQSEYVYLALINKTENKIQTFDKTITYYKRKFKMADNGSILCCLYYVYNTINEGKELHIERFVVKKTLLKYQLKQGISSNPAGVEKQLSSNENGYNWLLYLSAAILGVLVLILALYIILKKHCFTNSQSLDETVELDYQATQDQVLYASLDFKNDANQSRNQNEESHYANIVGVLHPL